MAANNGWLTRRLLRVALQIMLLPALPAAVRAANNCPWLTEATAGGLLGGTAVGTFTAGQPGQPSTCSFVDKESGGTRELTITVEINPDAHTQLAAMMHDCGASGSLLQAIGNEAAVCAMDSRRKSLAERVVGRVRDQIFTIAIMTSLKDDPVLDHSMLMTKIYTASEQVAGNLF